MDGLSMTKDASQNRRNRSVGRVSSPGVVIIRETRETREIAINAIFENLPLLLPLFYRCFTSAKNCT
jgi:hypothetical protein